MKPGGRVGSTQTASGTGGKAGLSLLHIIFASGSVFLIFYCFWAVAISQHAFRAIDSSNKMSAPSGGSSGLSSGLGLGLIGSGAGAELGKLEEFAEIVRKADVLAKEKLALRGSSDTGKTGSEELGKEQGGEKGAPQASLLSSRQALGLAIESQSPRAHESHAAAAAAEASQAVPRSPQGSDGQAATQTQTETAVESDEGRNVVLGMAQETDPKNLIVFCASLRAVSTADVVIFVNSPIPALHSQIADKYRVRLVPFDVSALDAAQQRFHPSSLRWGLMHKFLSGDEVRTQYDRVLMIDVRDSYFQSDPFELLRHHPAQPAARGQAQGTQESERFLVFKGVEDKSIGACGWNGKWISDCFSPQTYNAVADQSIICSGVSMGHISSTLQYLSLMSGIITGNGQGGGGGGGGGGDGAGGVGASLGSKFPSCERNGVDQGVHNVLVHRNLIPNMQVQDHQSGLVANLQARLSSVKGMAVSNRAGQPVAIVHQYDRYPELQRALFKKHVYWVDTDNPRAEWELEPACKSFSYKDNYDMFKGVCDMKMQGGATSAAACCKYCTALPGCMGFTYYSAKCFLKSCKTSSGAAGMLAGAVSGFRTS